MNVVQRKSLFGLDKWGGDERADKNNWIFKTTKMIEVVTCEYWFRVFLFQVCSRRQFMHIVQCQKNEHSSKRMVDLSLYDERL